MTPLTCLGGIRTHDGEPYSSTSFFMFIMATNLIFVSGKKNTENPILDGCRFVLDRKRNDYSYWKCILLFKYIRQCDLIEEYRIENSPVMASPRWEPCRGGGESVDNLETSYFESTCRTNVRKISYRLSDKCPLTVPDKCPVTPKLLSFVLKGRI